MPRARYHDAVDWIARNDFPAETDQASVVQRSTVVLAASVWDKMPTEVARDVISLRRRLKNEMLRAGN